MFNELKIHIRDIIYHDSRYFDKPRRLIAKAAGRLTHANIYGQFRRLQKELDRLVQNPVA